MTERHFALRVAADHPSLPGHFPGAPVVPGVVLLDLVQAQARDCWALGPLTGLPNVKFLAPLLPEQEARLTLARRDAHGVRFRIERDGELLAQGTMCFSAS